MQKTFRYKLLLFTMLVQAMMFGSVSSVASAAEISQTSPGNLNEVVTAATPQLVISAVQITGGTGRTQEDFIEFYNPTSEPFDLNGYRLVKRTATGVTDTSLQSWTSSKIVQPYHFFLWANSSYSGIMSSPDATTSGTIANDNGVALRHGAVDSGEVVESVAWGSTANGFESKPTENPGANISLVRKDLFSSNSQFESQPSSPRNSSVELLPEPPEEIEDPILDPQIDPAPDPNPDPASQTEPSPAIDTVPEEESSQEPDDQTSEEPTIDLPQNIGESQDSSEDSPENQNQELEIEEPASEVVLVITELLPNPFGTDSGKEQVEIYNAGESSVNLSGFRMDDIALNDSFSSNAYTFGNVNIEPGQYLAITLPAGKFTLNNTGGDVVSLFDGAGQALDSVEYSETSPEGQAYSLFETSWFWAPQTLGKSNGNPPVVEEDESDSAEEESDEDQEDNLGVYDNGGLIISEIYADPASGQKEFVEIRNTGEEIAQLSQVWLWVGEKHKALANHSLTPGNYFVINQDDLPAQLKNTGQIVKLTEAKESGELFSTVTYGKAVDAASFSWFEDGFQWTTKVTSGQENVLVLAEAVKKLVEPAAKKSAVKAINKTSTKATTAKKTATVKPSAVAKTVSTAKSNAPKTDESKPADQQLNSQQNKQKDSVGKIIAMGAAAVVAGVIALYKLVFAGTIE